MEDQDRNDAAAEALESAAEHHMQLPNSGNEPVDMVVEHKVQVTETHFLVGSCPTCGDSVTTNDPRAVGVFEQGKTVRSHCKCGQRLLVPGRSKILRPKDIGRIAVPGNINNRHARRAAAKSKPVERG